MKNVFYTILLGTLLFLVGSFLFYKHLFDNGFGVFNLLTNGSSSDLVSTRSGELLKGDKVLGSFNSEYSNLGIVSVRFNNQNRDSNDILVFRLKENGSSNWYYEAKYKTDQFLPGKLFPFGFPFINDSDGKVYTFELESLQGATGSGIYLDGGEPVFTAASFFSKSDIMADKAWLAGFVVQKITNVIKDQASLRMAMVYFSPFISFFLFLLLKSASYHFLAVGVLFFINWEIFNLKNSYDIVLLSVASLWILIVHKHQFESKISAFIAIFILSMIPILTIFDSENYAEKASVWAYIFSSITVLQLLSEYRKKPKKQFTLNRFLKLHLDIKLEDTDTKNMFLRRTVLISSCLISLNFIKSAYLVVHDGLFLLSDFQYKFYSGRSILYVLLITVAIYTVFKVTSHFFYRAKINKIFFVIPAYILNLLLSIITANVIYFQYSPTIFSISPEMTSEAWVDVTITGKNFQDLPFVGKVTLAGEEKFENIISWSNEKIIFRTNPATTKTGDVCVNTLSKGTSNCLPFKYNFGK